MGVLQNLTSILTNIFPVTSTTLETTKAVRKREEAIVITWMYCLLQLTCNHMIHPIRLCNDHNLLLVILSCNLLNYYPACDLHA